jgi:hypothetical protein
MLDNKKLKENNEKYQELFTFLHQSLLFWDLRSFDYFLIEKDQKLLNMLFQRHI